MPWLLLVQPEVDRLIEWSGWSAPVTARPRPAAQVGGGGVSSDRQSLVRRARAYLARLEPAVSGQGGHDRTFYAAARLVEYGLTRDESWSLLIEYGERCVPPWSERELRHKLDQAFDRTRPRAEFAEDRPMAAAARPSANGHASANGVAAPLPRPSAREPHPDEQFLDSAAFAGQCEILRGKWPGFASE